MKIEAVDFMNDRTANEMRTLEAWAVFDETGAPVYLSMDYEACYQYLKNVRAAEGLEVVESYRCPTCDGELVLDDVAGVIYCEASAGDRYTEDVGEYMPKRVAE